MSTVGDVVESAVISALYSESSSVYPPLRIPVILFLVGAGSYCPGC